VSNMRNSDGTIRARIRFTEDPENAYIQRFMDDGTVSTAVMWDVQGLRPHAIFKLHVLYYSFPKMTEKQGFWQFTREFEYWEYHHRRIDNEIFRCLRWRERMAIPDQ
jgi:hypothetical protein